MGKCLAVPLCLLDCLETTPKHHRHSLARHQEEHKLFQQIAEIAVDRGMQIHRLAERLLSKVDEVQHGSLQLEKTNGGVQLEERLITSNVNGDKLPKSSHVDLCDDDSNARDSVADTLSGTMIAFYRDEAVAAKREAQSEMEKLQIKFQNMEAFANELQHALKEKDSMILAADSKLALLETEARGSTQEALQCEQSLETLQASLHAANERAQQSDDALATCRRTFVAFQSEAAQKIEHLENQLREKRSTAELPYVVDTHRLEAEAARDMATRSQNLADTLQSKLRDVEARAKLLEDALLEQESATAMADNLVDRYRRKAEASKEDAAQAQSMAEQLQTRLCDLEHIQQIQTASASVTLLSDPMIASYKKVADIAKCQAQQAQRSVDMLERAMQTQAKRFEEEEELWSQDKTRMLQEIQRLQLNVHCIHATHECVSDRGSRIGGSLEVLPVMPADVKSAQYSHRDRYVARCGAPAMTGTVNLPVCKREDFRFHKDHPRRLRCATDPCVSPKAGFRHVSSSASVGNTSVKSQNGTPNGHPGNVSPVTSPVAGLVSPLLSPIAKTTSAPRIASPVRTSIASVAVSPATSTAATVASSARGASPVRSSTRNWDNSF